MNWIKRWVEKLLSFSFVRFIIVGGISTVVHFSIYLSLVYMQTSPNIAYLAAFSVSVICNYFLSSYFTFQVKPGVKRGLQFLGAHLLNLTNELILLNVFLYCGIDKFVAPVLVFAVAFPVNFFIVRYALKGNLWANVRKWLGTETQKG